jgi:hypothetical protein
MQKLQQFYRKEKEQEDFFFLKEAKNASFACALRYLSFSFINFSKRK